MNANLPPKTPKLKEWLLDAIAELKAVAIPSARLDAEIILAHTIRKPRTYLHAYPNEKLDLRHLDIANARLQLRLEHTPIAYIVGHKEFYGRRFKTTPAALVPRPESEVMIELLAGIMPVNLPLVQERKRLVDVGTGSGILGITTKLEWPELDVTLTDISTHALNLAKENAKLFGVDIAFFKGDLLGGYGRPIDIVLANLPYVDRSWEVSPDTRAEPEQALFASDNGLALIRRLIIQASGLMSSKGSLFLESDKRQQAAIIQFATEHGFKHQTSRGLIIHFIKN